MSHSKITRCSAGHPHPPSFPGVPQDAGRVTSYTGCVLSATPGGTWHEGVGQFQLERERGRASILAGRERAAKCHTQFPPPVLFKGVGATCVLSHWRCWPVLVGSGWFDPLLPILWTLCFFAVWRRRWTLRSLFARRCVAADGVRPLSTMIGVGRAMAPVCGGGVRSYVKAMLTLGGPEAGAMQAVPG